MITYTQKELADILEAIESMDNLDEIKGYVTGLLIQINTWGNVQ